MKKVRQRKANNMILLIGGCIWTNDTNELIGKTDFIDFENDLWLPGGRIVGRDRLRVWV